MTNQKRRYTIEQAILALNDHFGLKGENMVAKSTIYKYLSRRYIGRYGAPHKQLIDLDELIQVVTYGPKKRSVA